MFIVILIELLIKIVVDSINIIIIIGILVSNNNNNRLMGIIITLITTVISAITTQTIEILTIEITKNPISTFQTEHNH